MVTGKRKRSFTKAFEDEAVRLAEAGGRTRREIARDLGIGRSTLMRWMRLRRLGAVPPTVPVPDDGLASELRRLQQENLRLRSERDVFMKAAALFARAVCISNLSDPGDA